jgi:hypothetical protein
MYPPLTAYLNPVRVTGDFRERKDLGNASFDFAQLS